MMVINSEQALTDLEWKCILIYFIRAEIHFTKPASMKHYLSRKTPQMQILGQGGPQHMDTKIDPNLNNGPPRSGTCAGPGGITL